MKKNTKATLMGAIALPAALALALAGCAAQGPTEPVEADQETTEQEQEAEPTPEQDEATSGESEQEQAEASQEDAEEAAADSEDAIPDPGTHELIGGWEVLTEATPTVDEVDIDRFEQAAEGLLGVEYEPICMLAKQMVSGTNYAYLCTGTVVEPEESTGWYVVTIYEDLDGNISMGAVNQIDIRKLVVSNDAAARVAGGWQVVEMSVSKLLPQEAQTAFSTALQSYVGVNLRPLAVLGTQVVKGTNYLVLCEGAPVAVDPINSLYVAQVHAGLDDSAEFIGVDMFDLPSYVGN